MAWMLQPHSYSQIIRPNLYNVAYKRVGTYKGMGRDVSIGPAYYPHSIPNKWGLYRRGLGQCTDPTNPACVSPSGTDIYQIGSGGQLLAQSQYIGSAPSGYTLTPTTNTTTTLTNLLPWILGGVLVIALVAKK